MKVGEKPAEKCLARRASVPYDRVPLMKFPVHLAAFVLLVLVPGAGATSVAIGDQVVVPTATPVQSISGEKPGGPVLTSPTDAVRVGEPAPALPSTDGPLAAVQAANEAPTAQISAVPEPGALIIFGIGLLALFRKRRS